VKSSEIYGRVIAQCGGNYEPEKSFQMGGKIQNRAEECH
jgi:hypothetical protein